jgi:hypothetical protein
MEIVVHSPVFLATTVVPCRMGESVKSCPWHLSDELCEMSHMLEEEEEAENLNRNATRYKN